MAQLLDYAGPSVKPIRKLWPRALFAVLIAAYSLALLVFNCVVGLIDVGSTGQHTREEAWLRVLADGAMCVLAFGIGWLIARRLHWRTRQFTFCLWVCCAIWICSIVAMIVRLAI